MATEESKRPIYLDYSATTPVDPEVMEVVRFYMMEEFGNAGSRTHEYGARAKKAVENAREVLAAELGVRTGDAIFTSGATEANNLAILGLEAEGRRTGRMHLISSQIEHKAVLEPLAEMERRGFEVTLLRPERNGVVHAAALKEALRPDTLLVSLMHVNNEIGTIQDIAGYSDALADHPAFFHMDAAQSFAKMPVNFARVDIVSASGHKIGAPKGVGILGMRRRKWALPPVKPLMFGGGQEFGLRPGTLAVPLIAGMAEATRRTKAVAPTCNSATVALRDALLSIARNAGFEPLTDPHVTAPWVIPLKSMTDDSEAVLLRLKHIIAASNGAACTSSAYTKSHVLHALDPSLPGFLRLSIYAPLASRELTRVDSISLRGR